MNSGLTPKMKPLPPKRVGDGRRARHRHQQDRLPDRAPQAAQAAGRAAPAHPRASMSSASATRCPRHEGRRGGRSRRGRSRGAPRGRSRRAHGQDAARFGRGLGLRRPPGERAHLRHRRRRGLGHRRARHRPRARRRQPPFGAPRHAPCCIRCRSAMRSTAPRGIRDPRGMLARQFRRRHACRHRRHRGCAQSHARGRALPSRGRGDGGERPMWRAFPRSPTTKPISAPP